MRIYKRTFFPESPDRRHRFTVGFAGCSRRIFECGEAKMKRHSQGDGTASAKWDVPADKLWGGADPAFPSSISVSARI